MVTYDVRSGDSFVGTVHVHAGSDYEALTADGRSVGHFGALGHAQRALRTVDPATKASTAVTVPTAAIPASATDEASATRIAQETVRASEATSQAEAADRVVSGLVRRTLRGERVGTAMAVAVAEQERARAGLTALPTGGRVPSDLSATVDDALERHQSASVMRSAVARVNGMNAQSVTGEAHASRDDDDYWDARAKGPGGGSGVMRDAIRRINNRNSGSNAHAVEVEPRGVMAQAVAAINAKKGTSADGEAPTNPIMAAVAKINSSRLGADENRGGVNVRGPRGNR
jgi:hypothetical protein